MRKATGELGLAQRLAKRLFPFTLGVGLLISLGIPGIYYSIGSYSLKHTAAIHAEELSGRLQELVFNAPSLWKYQAPKYLQVPHYLQRTDSEWSLPLYGEFFAR